MPDNRVRLLAQASSFRHAAVQRILRVAGMDTDRENGSRPFPAKVYPSADGAADWVVEPPASEPSGSTKARTFSGSAALAEALEYAHRTYGSALYLSR